MSDAVTRLQEELSQCKNSIHSLSEKMTVVKATTTFGQANVQTPSVFFQAEKACIPNRPSLESTRQPGMADEVVGSPGGSTIPGEIKN